MAQRAIQGFGRRFGAALGASLSLALLAGFASAQSGAAAQGQKVLKDPQGVRGISPFWEKVNQGDRAYLARDFEAAIREYRAAIAEAPRNGIGHYRLAEAQMTQGNLAEAEASLENALRFAGGNAALKGKVLFLLADLKERAGQYDDATQRYTEYEAVVADPDAKGHPKVAAQRKQRIAERQQFLKDYAQVKERIAKRLEEATGSGK